ncbi:MAG: hypothetical protein AABW79_04060 [Nanoarchaeota archaeon]
MVILSDFPGKIVRFEATTEDERAEPGYLILRINKFFPEEPLDGLSFNGARIGPKGIEHIDFGYANSNGDKVKKL